MSAVPSPLPSPDVRRAFPQIPGPPIVHNMLQAMRDPLGFFTASADAYGEDLHMRFLHKDYLLLTSAEAMQHVLVTHPERYDKSINYDGLKYVLGRGLLTSEGAFWKKQRRLMQPAFHKHELAGFVDGMTEVTLEAVERWRDTSRGGFDLHAELMRLTLRIVGLTLLSCDLDGEAKAVGKALTIGLRWANEHVESIVRIPPWVPTLANLRFGQAKRTLDAVVLRIVAGRRAAPSDPSRRRDLLDMLLEAKDADSGESMDDEQIKHEILTLILAGHETTANALTFLYYAISSQPDVRARIRAEVDAVLGDRMPTPADLKKLEYVTCVIEEAMRLYPPAWIFERQANQDDVIAGAKIEKGWITMLCPYVVHRSARHWDDPLRFDPERFRPERKSQIGKHVYMPFGAGHRFCIGNNFAMMEMQLIVALLATRGQFTVEAGYQPVLEPQVTLRPKAGMPGRFHAA